MTVVVREVIDVKKNLNKNFSWKVFRKKIDNCKTKIIKAILPVTFTKNSIFLFLSPMLVLRN